MELYVFSGVQALTFILSVIFGVGWWNERQDRKLTGETLVEMNSEYQREAGRRGAAEVAIMNQQLELDDLRAFVVKVRAESLRLPDYRLEE